MNFMMVRALPVCVVLQVKSATSIFLCTWKMKIRFQRSIFLDTMRSYLPQLSSAKKKRSGHISNWTTSMCCQTSVKHSVIAAGRLGAGFHSHQPPWGELRHMKGCWTVSSNNLLFKSNPFTPSGQWWNSLRLLLSCHCSVSVTAFHNVFISFGIQHLICFGERWRKNINCDLSLKP